MCSWPPQLWNLGHLDILYLPFKLIDVFTVQVPYPDWAHWLGWVLVGISAVQVPPNFYFRFDVFVHDMNYFALVCKKVAMVENFNFSRSWLPWLPGAPVGGVDEPGVPVQEEVDQSGQADQGVGPWRSPGRIYWFNFSITNNDSLFVVRSFDHFAYFYLHRKHQIICAQVRRAIYEEQHNIAPGRKHNYSSNYNTGYDNQVHYI